MKSRFMIFSAAAAILVAAPFVRPMMPVQAAGTTLVAQAPIQLTLSAEKRVLHSDGHGRQLATWVGAAAGASIQPGDVIRYTVTASNVSSRAVPNLVINQPIPTGTQYVLYSATSSPRAGIDVSYSVDGGQTYSSKPTVFVKQPDGTVVSRPAPASAYTHLRWAFASPLSAGETARAIYQVVVR